MLSIWICLITSGLLISVYADHMEVLKDGRYSPLFSSSVPNAESNINGFTI
jgi:hypothetical protein